MYLIKEQKKIMYSISEYLLENSNKYSLDYNMFFNIRTTLDSNNKICNDITDLLPQHKSNTPKDIYKFLYMSLDNMMSDPNIPLESFADKNLLNKLMKQSHFLITKENISNSEFNKDILNFLQKDELLKFQKIVEDSNQYLNSKETAEYLQKLDKNIILTKLIFYEIISEISVENKERAELLYRLFNKIFCVQIQCLLSFEERMHQKIEVYKKLTNFIIEKYRSKDDETIDMKEISDTLLDSNLSNDNLLKHKKIIQNLLNEIKVNNKNVFQYKLDYSLLEHDINLWIYNFDDFKYDIELRKKFKEFNKEEFIKPYVAYLNKNNNLSKVERALFINSKIFSFFSHYNMKEGEEYEYYINELKKLKNNIEKLNESKEEQVQKYSKTVEIYNTYKQEKEKEIYELKSKLNQNKKDAESQTDIDLEKYKKIQLNNDLVVSYKKLNHSKLDDILQRIRWKIVSCAPLSLNSLFSLLADLLVSHSSYIPTDLSKTKIVLQFDEYFFDYMLSKLKLKKLVKKHSTRAIYSIIYYASEDKRIDLIRRFMGIGVNKIRNEVVNYILIILEKLPVPIINIFSSKTKYEDFIISTDRAISIISTNFKKMSLAKHVTSNIISVSSIFINPNNESFENLTPLSVSFSTKLELFYFKRFFERNSEYIHKIKIDYMNQNIDTIRKRDFLNKFTFENNEVGLTFEDSEKILDKYLEKSSDDPNDIKIDKLIQLYNNNYSFSISISSFIDQIIVKLSFFYDKLFEKARNIFFEFDRDENRYFDKEEFKAAIKLIIGDDITDKKLKQLFDIAESYTDKEYITMEEWFYFVLNCEDIYIRFFNAFFLLGHL